MNTAEEMFVAPGLITFLAAMTMAAGGASMVVDQDSLIPMGVFVAGIAIVSTLVWKAGVQFQKLQGKFDKTDYRLTRLEDDVIELKSGKRPHGTFHAREGRE